MSAHNGSSGWATEAPYHTAIIKNPQKRKKGSKPCFPVPHRAEIWVCQRKRITVKKVFGHLCLYRATRLSLNPKSGNEIWPIKTFLTSSSRIWWTDFTVTAGKLRRCCVQEAQQEFNPNPFSSWFLAQISLLINWMGPFLFFSYVWFHCGFQKYL